MFDTGCFRVLVPVKLVEIGFFLVLAVRVLLGAVVRGAAVHTAVHAAPLLQGLRFRLLGGGLLIFGCLFLELFAHLQFHIFLEVSLDTFEEFELVLVRDIGRGLVFQVRLRRGFG